MIGDTPLDDGRDEAANGLTVTDPTAAAARHGLAVETGTLDHDSAEYCERDAVGTAIVGVTDADGRVLAAVDPARDLALPPNDTVPAERDWAAVARETVAGTTGSAATLAGVRRVRETTHRVDGEPVGTIHHVVFGARLADDTVGDGLCDTNPFELRWLDADEPAADLALFVEER
jgi:hypothetical protein